MELDNLEIVVQSDAQNAASGIDKLSSSLSALKQTSKGGAGLTSVSNQLNKLKTALSGIANLDKIQQIGTALNSLSSVQKSSGLTSTINALSKIPKITEQLRSEDLYKFSQQIKVVTNAIKPLAAEMEKVSAGFSAFPIRIQKIIQSNTGLAASNKSTGSSFSSLGGIISKAQLKFGVYFAAFRQIANVMAGWVTQSNAYVENLNLFTVAMGEYADEAKAYAEEVHEALGIDLSEWMRNQGTFMQIASGFGVVSDKAALMSKNLTQIGYDISSFYNISIEEAMQKVQSGISGELEPLRRLGYALDVATLQQVAYNHGITQNINTMTQAQKSQLRYLAIMEQSKNVMGDMARTVQTPANAMRILNQQMTQLQRALGNLILPLLQKILPYVQGFVEALTEIIQRLAVMVGFELPQIDYSGMDGLSAGAEDTADGLNDAADAAKKLRNNTLGFDELNIISPDTGVDDSETGGSYDLGIELPEYDFLQGLDTQADSIKDKILDFFDKWGGAIKTVGELILTVLLSKKIISGLSTISTLFKGMGETSFKQFVSGIGASTTKTAKLTKAIMGAGGLAFGFVAAKDGAEELYSALNGGGGSLESGITSLVTGGASAVIGGLIIGGPMGALVGALIAAAGAVIGVKDAQAQLRVEMLRTDFYDINGAKIEDVRQSLQNYFNSMDFDKHAQWVQTIETATESYNNAQSSYDNMWQTIANKPVFDASDIEGLSEAFNELAEAAANVNDARIDVLMQTIASSIKNNITPALNDQLGDLLNRLQEAQQLLGAKIAGIQKQYNDVLVAIEENGGVATDQQKQKLQELREELAFYTIAEDYSTKQWETSISDAVNQGINAGDNAEQVKASVEALIEDRDEYLDNLKELYSQNSNTIEQLIKMGFVDKNGNALFSQTDLDNLKKNYDEQRAQAIRQYNAALDTIIQGFESKALNPDDYTFWNTGNSLADAIGNGLWTIGTLGDDLFFGNGADKRAEKELAKEQQELIEELKNMKLSLSSDWARERGLTGLAGYATGGFPQTGELFLARESGPELVGSVGNRTAVVNNDQIIQGIAQAVYNAMMAANQNGDNDIVLNINQTLDGDVIYNNQMRVKRNRGANIVTNPNFI